MTHQPVLLSESLSGLAIQPDGLYVDATFGRGGHSRAILSRLSSTGRLIVVDQDPEAIAIAHAIGDERITVVHESFAALAQVIEEAGCLGQVNGLLMDVGVSSPQLDDAQRGFSFNQNGPLDMRMNTAVGQTAASYINTVSEADLCQVLWRFGEERFARRIAAAIIAAREETRIDTTARLADVVQSAVPLKHTKRHPATKTFQAIRIHINDELSALSSALCASLSVLAPAGRLCVISFHSLEDRIVKQFIRDHAQQKTVPHGLPVAPDSAPLLLKKVGKLIKPGDAELEDNPRSRSARLRVAERR